MMAAAIEPGQDRRVIAVLVFDSRAPFTDPDNVAGDGDGGLAAVVGAAVFAYASFEQAKQAHASLDDQGACTFVTMSGATSKGPQSDEDVFCIVRAQPARPAPAAPAAAAAAASEGARQLYDSSILRSGVQKATRRFLPSTAVRLAAQALHQAQEPALAAGNQGLRKLCHRQLVVAAEDCSGLGLSSSCAALLDLAATSTFYDHAADEHAVLLSVAELAGLRARDAEILDMQLNWTVVAIDPPPRRPVAAGPAAAATSAAAAVIREEAGKTPAATWRDTCASSMSAVAAKVFALGRDAAGQRALWAEAAAMLLLLGARVTHDRKRHAGVEPRKLFTEGPAAIFVVAWWVPRSCASRLRYPPFRGPRAVWRSHARTWWLSWLHRHVAALPH